MNDILSILSMPEGRTIEFKQDLSSIKPILKTLIAFANTAGGTLLIGRDNAGNILGIDDVFKTEEKLANVIADSISPPLIPEIEITTAEGKPLLLVRVAHWPGPFYLKAEGPVRGVYVRLGSTNRAASPELLAELQRSSSKLSFDQLPCPEVDVSGLDMDKIERTFSGVDVKVTQQKLLTLGVLVSHSGRLVCSNGGIILFGQRHVRELYFPNTAIRCARFQGVDKTQFVDHYDVEGTLIDAMEEVPKFIKRNTRLSAKIENIQRQDIPEYSLVAVREVLTNALVHADYSLKGMHPRVAIFSDRLEIESPGMLPFGYALEDFFAGVSHIRNKVIARVFRELRIMEEWGTGFKRVSMACTSGGYPIPSWKEVGQTLQVVFYPHSHTSEEGKTVPKPIDYTISPRQQEILHVFQPNEKITAKEVHKRLGLSISERSIRVDLQLLREKKLLMVLGKGRGTLWMLA